MLVAKILVSVMYHDVECARILELGRRYQGTRMDTIWSFRAAYVHIPFRYLTANNSSLLATMKHDP